MRTLVLPLSLIFMGAASIAWAGQSPLDEEHAKRGFLVGVATAMKAFQADQTDQAVEIARRQISAAPGDLANVPWWEFEKESRAFVDLADLLVAAGRQDLAGELLRVTAKFLIHRPQDLVERACAIVRSNPEVLYELDRDGASCPLEPREKEVLESIAESRIDQGRATLDDKRFLLSGGGLTLIRARKLSHAFPDQVDVWNALGKTAATQGQLRQSLRAYRKALRLRRTLHAESESANRCEDAVQVLAISDPVRRVQVLADAAHASDDEPLVRMAAVADVLRGRRAASHLVAKYASDAHPFDAARAYLELGLIEEAALSFLRCFPTPAVPTQS